MSWSAPSMVPMGTIGVSSIHEGTMLGTGDKDVKTHLCPGKVYDRVPKGSAASSLSLQGQVHTSAMLRFGRSRCTYS